MNFNEVVQMIKGSCSWQIFSLFGYDDTRKKYTAIETSSHNNADLHPSMGLYQSGDSFFLKDFAGEQKRYSSIDLIMINEGLNFADAVRRGAEICGIKIDKTKTDTPPDMRFIIAGLYRKAEREHFIVRDILATYHYHYKDAEGKKLFDKYRIDFISGDGKKEKHIHQGIEHNGFVRKFKPDEYKSLIAMYGDFRQYQVGERVYIPEGEECVKSCHGKGMQNVVTAGSSNDWKSKGKKFAVFFKGTDVVILQDNDYAGEKLTNDIISSLNGVAASIKVVVPDRSREKADIADFFSNGGTVQQLEGLIANTPYYNGNKGKKETDTKIEADGCNPSSVDSFIETLVKLKVAEKFATNDKGSAELYATVLNQLIAIIRLKKTGCIMMALNGRMISKECRQSGMQRDWQMH